MEDDEGKCGGKEGWVGQAEDGIRDREEGLEFRRVLFLFFLKQKTA